MTNMATVLNSMRDPMGVPFYPWMFQALMVLTFALHIIFVNLVIGGASLAMYGHIKGKEEPKWKRLSATLARASTVNLSLAIVLGVAPLLFVQVIYDPFWYFSNVLSGWWAMGFLLFICIAFLALYVFYLKRGENIEGYGFFGAIALVMLALTAITISALSVQSLHPEKWDSWYLIGKHMNTAGTALHDLNIARLLHFIVPSFAITGIFLMLYSWYFEPRKDFDHEYLTWVGKTGAKLALYFTLLQIVVGVWWLLTIPKNLDFLTNPALLGGAAVGVVTLVILVGAQKNPQKQAIPVAFVAFLAVLAMSITREVLRMEYLGKFNYSIYTYKLNLDWGSTFLFFATFVMGLIVISYPIIIAFKLGRGTDVTGGE